MAVELLPKVLPKILSRSGRSTSSLAGVLLRYGPGYSTVTPSATRASTGTYKDAGGTRQSAAINGLRDSHYVSGERTILIEGLASTNHFLQSGTPATQTSPVLATGKYTLWMEGIGSITVSAGTATITGAGVASAGVNVTFTVTVGGTVTYTVAGSPTLAQAENAPVATSYIPTTGAPVTRQGDVLRLPYAPTPQISTMLVTFYELGSALLGSGFPAVVHLGSGTTARQILYAPNTSQYQFEVDNAASSSLASPVVASALGNRVELRTVALPGNQARFGVTMNGGAESVQDGVAGPGFATAFDVQTLSIGVNVSASGNYGLLALVSLKVATGVRTLAEMRAL